MPYVTRGGNRTRRATGAEHHHYRLPRRSPVPRGLKSRVLQLVEVAGGGPVVVLLDLAAATGSAASVVRQGQLFWRASPGNVATVGSLPLTC